MGSVPLAGTLALTVALAGACRKDHPGVLVELRVKDEQFRPQAVRFHWMEGGELLIDGRLPPQGSFTSQGELLGTIFIELDGPLQSQRLLTVQGVNNEQGERQDGVDPARVFVSGVARVVEPSTEKVIRLELELREPLPNRDNNRLPDIVEDKCLTRGADTCLGRPEPAPPDDGVDAGAPPGPPPDAGPTPDGTPPPPPDARPGGEAGAEVAPADAAPVLETDLVGYWRFDDNAGTSARDSSGQNNTATVRGPGPTTAWIPGKLGTALDVPMANNNGVLVPASASLDAIHSAFTIAAWTYRTSHRSGTATVIGRQYQTSGSEHFGLAFQNGTLRGMVNTQLGGSGTGNVLASAPSPLNAWVHVAFTFDGITLRLYQDGVQVGAAAYGTRVLAERTIVTLGCAQNGSSPMSTEDTLAGRLDEVLLYTRALAPTEIARLAEGQQPQVAPAPSP